MSTRPSKKFNSRKSAKAASSRSRANLRSRLNGLGFAPVAMSKGTGQQRLPRVASNGICTHINHTEYFDSVVSPGAPYAVSSFPVNPGVATMFPWLSQVASRYETYKFRSLAFHYHSRSATSQVGTVGLAFDFDAKDPAPTSQMIALSYHDRVADAVWKEQSLVLDLAQGDRLPTRYTRVGLPAGTYDIKTYDLGNLHIFTDGVAASNNLGLVEVVYSIDLYTPQIQDPVGGSCGATAGLDATHLVGTDMVADPEAILPFVFTSDSVLTFTQIFEGMLYFFLTAPGAAMDADWAPHISADGTAVVVNQTTAANQTAGMCKVSAVYGTTLTPTITAGAGVSTVYYAVAAGGYGSF